MPHDPGLQELLEELAQVRGLDFRGYKTASLQRRLQKRIAQLNLGSYREYFDFFRHNSAEINHLLSVVLINVTEFFRDPAAWEALRKEAFPLIFSRIKPGDSLRAWCAGCASGEEVYSLAILLAEELGPRLADFDVKLYATDHDEDALNVARRGEYTAEHLRRVRPEWRQKYFGGGSVLRVNRELRRLAIFGRSNLVSDAPISHVNLLICRNVLIYFDVGLQGQVLEKFRYALEPEGILFLGKSESQLREWAPFRPINAKWRIFACTAGPNARDRREETTAAENHREMEQARLMQRYFLETVRSALVMVDVKGVIASVNDAALTMWGIANGNIVGTPLTQSPFAERCPALVGYMQQSVSQPKLDPLTFQCKITVNAEERSLELVLRPVLENDGARTGTLLYCEDISGQERLRSTIEELETTAEELHSANEELETTNEELQSTNEELETTNEELQSSNEELETTNEELHSLNEELETTNHELEQRTRQMEEISGRYAETLALMPSPVAIVNDASEILLWNSAAEKLFELEAKSVIGLKLTQLPVQTRLRNALARRCDAMKRGQQNVSLPNLKVKLDGFQGTLEVRLMAISGASGRGVLIVFDPRRGGFDSGLRGSAAGGKTRTAKKKRRPSKAKPRRRPAKKK